MGKEHGDPNSKAFSDAFARFGETQPARILPIIVKPSEKERVSNADVQAWVDTLDDRQQGMLRLLMERCVSQGRIQALADAIDTAAACGRTLERGEAQKQVTRVMSALMRGRMAALEDAKKKGFG